MRVKINDVWYDSEETPICLELSATEKDHLRGIGPEATMYASYSEEWAEGKTPDEIRAWMKEQTEPVFKIMPIE